MSDMHTPYARGEITRGLRSVKSERCMEGKLEVKFRPTQQSKRRRGKPGSATPVSPFSSHRWMTHLTLAVGDGKVAGVAALVGGELALVHLLVARGVKSVDGKVVGLAVGCVLVAVR
jgi:hypothetical protein